MSMRGVQKAGASTMTSRFTGVFQEDARAQMLEPRPPDLDSASHACVTDAAPEGSKVRSLRRASMPMALTRITMDAANGEVP